MDSYVISYDIPDDKRRTKVANSANTLRRIRSPGLSGQGVFASVAWWCELAQSGMIGGEEWGRLELLQGSFYLEWGVSPELKQGSESYQCPKGH